MAVELVGAASVAGENSTCDKGAADISRLLYAGMSQSSTAEREKNE